MLNLLDSDIRGHALPELRGPRGPQRAKTDAEKVPKEATR